MKSILCDLIMTIEKKKMGRPKKEVHGVALWIPSEYVDAMQKFLSNSSKVF